MDLPSLPALGELALRSTAILALTFGIAACARRASAATRAAVWLTSFVALATLAGTTALDLRPRVEVPAVRVEAVPIPNASAPTPFILDEAATASARALDVPRLLATGWLVGAGFVCIALALGLTLASRERRRSRPLPASLRRATGAFPDLTMRLSSTVKVPCLIGLLRPVVLLPTSATHWPAERLHATLRHEAEHARRRDPLTRALALLVCAALWPHPLVWLALRRLRAAQEQACDDAVLRAGGSPGDYGQILVDTARSATGLTAAPIAALSMARPGTLEERLRALFDDRRDRRTCRPLILGGALVLALSGGLLASTSTKSAADTSERPRSATIRGTILSVAPASAFAKDLANGQVLSPAQAQALLESLTSAKGVDRLSTPTVWCASGHPVEIFSGSDSERLELRVTPLIQGESVALNPTLSLDRKGSTPREVNLPSTWLKKGELLVVRAAGSPQILMLISAEVNPLAPAAGGTDDLPIAMPVPGKPGFVQSPFSLDGYVDVRGYPPGAQVKDPFTKKMFRVPEGMPTTGDDFSEGQASPEVPVDITGDKTSFENGFAVASGNATFRHGATRITADELRYKPDERVVDFRGNVVIAENGRTERRQEFTYRLGASARQTSSGATSETRTLEAQIGVALPPGNVTPAPSATAFKPSADNPDHTSLEVPSPDGAAPGVLSGEFVGVLENNGGWIATGSPKVRQGNSLIEGTAPATTIIVRPDGRVSVQGDSRTSVVP